MGLSASQARILMLYARQSDLEQRGQTINNRRMLLANLTAEAAREYSDAMSNRSFKIKIPGASTNDSSWVDVDSALLKLKMNSGDLQVQQRNADGSYKTITADQLSDENPDLLYNDVKDGYLKIQQKGSDGSWEDMSVEDGTMQDGLYTADDQAATAVYDEKQAEFQSQDKMLEMELKNIDTQHQAITTEIDAVKKVIDKNIEMSFKTFG